MTETEDSAVANMKLENELKKLERDDFNNIVGMSQLPSKKYRLGRNQEEQLLKDKTSQKASQIERYKIGNLSELLVEEDAATGEEKI